MFYKTLVLLGMAMSLSIQSAFTSEQIKEEKVVIRKKMHKQLKGELFPAIKVSTCAENDTVCKEKEIAESKELMHQKLKGKKPN